MSTKPEQTVRVGYENINILSESARKYKSKQLVNHIRDASYDAFMMGEVGLFWPKIDTCDQWDKPVTAIFGFNNTEPDVTQKLQYGGVGIVEMGEIKHRITAPGKDPSSLGRWVWMRMTGKEGHITRFVTVYRPCVGGGGS
jgi:hypothetical protein